MLSEISCWHVNWNAIGAIGSGAAAIIALIVWITSLVVIYLKEKKRVRVYGHLLTEELSRISSVCTFLYDNHQQLRDVLIDRAKAEMILMQLSSRQIAELIKLTDQLPEKVAVEVAKLSTDRKSVV